MNAVVPLYAWLGALTLALVTLSGCLGAGSDADGARLLDEEASRALPRMDILDDPEGDAREYGQSLLASQSRVCNAIPLSEAHAPCFMAASTATGAVPASAGPPAPPELDVTAVRMTETAQNLIVEVELAALPSDFGAYLAADDSRTSWLSVCWNTGLTSDYEGESQDVWECIYTFLWSTDGTAYSESYFDTYSGECNDWWWCSRAPGTDFEFGTPGVARWAFPRVLMASADEGANLTEVVFANGIFDRRDTSVSYGATTPLRAISGSLGLGTRAVPDVAEEGSYTFRSAAAAPTPHGEFRVDRPKGDFEGLSERPELDIVGVEVHENATHVAFSTELATLPTQHEPIHVGVDFGMPSGRVYDAGVTLHDDHVDTWGGYCADQDCTQWVTLDVWADVQHGSPGRVALIFEKADLGDPQTGEATTLLYAYTNSPATFPLVEVQAGPLSAYADISGSPVDIFAPQITDWSGVTPPYWFRE